MTNQALKEHFDALLRLKDELGVTLDSKVVRIGSLISDDEAKAIAERANYIRMEGAFESLTQNELAERIGMQRTIVSRFERSDKHALNYLFLIADGLRVRPEWLLFGTGAIYDQIQSGLLEAYQCAQNITSQLKTIIQLKEVLPQSEVDKIYNSLNEISQSLPQAHSRKGTGGENPFKSKMDLR